MSIPNFGNKIKFILKQNKILFFNALVLIFIAISSFLLGRLSGIDESFFEDQSSQDILIVNGDIPLINEEIKKEEIMFVASKNGKMYYDINCSGAKRIKPENQILFKNSEEAEKSGFVYSKKCQK